MLCDQIRSDLILAMKAKDALRVSVLRMVVSALGYKKIDVQKDLGDEDVLGVIANEAKKRREAIASYLAAGRAAQAETESLELAILQTYLPKTLTEDELRAEILKLNLPKDFPGAMKIASPMFRGKADGAVVAGIVKELVNG